MLLSVITALMFISPFEQEDEFIKIQAQPKTLSTTQVASLWLIALHQNFLTHIDGPRSHFMPCSSTYMKQAILKHGFFYGSLLGLDRLMRENDEIWAYKKIKLDEHWIKLDPVP